MLHGRAIGRNSLRIFVTGAAGLIGGEVARRLVANGHRVTAMVHRNREVRGNDGRPVAVDEVIRGDLTAPGLGWTDARHDATARAHDLIVHCAATTRFDLSLAEYHAVNVEGTARIVELARAGAAALLHVGTAYACGTRNGAIAEDDPLPASGFANGYEASKAAGEALVAASGVPHAVVRPSIVVGEHATGAIRQFDAIYTAFKLMATGRVGRLPARADATLDLVPIDHVAAGIVAVAERMDRADGGRFHLVSGDAIPVVRLAATIAGYPQFRAPALVSPDRFDPAELAPAERRLHARVIGPYGGYFQRRPAFDDRRLRALTGLACPPTGSAYLARLIDHGIARGFLPSGPPPDHAAPGPPPAA